MCRTRRRPALFAIATVTGTERDPQCRSPEAKIAALEDAGIAVVDSLPRSHSVGRWGARFDPLSLPLSSISSPFYGSGSGD